MDDQRNLLEETLRKLTEYGYTTKAVCYVYAVPDSSHLRRSDPQWCTWDEFASRADFEYDAGYGGTEVNDLLRIVGDDWWLERHEYDGSEWWEYKALPPRPDTHNTDLELTND